MHNVMYIHQAKYYRTALLDLPNLLT